MISLAVARIAKRSTALANVSVRNFVAPLKEINFLLKDVYKIEDHYKSLGFSTEECNADVIEMVLTESAKFTENVLAPLNAVGDQVGCKLVNPNTVTVPPGFKDAYDQYTEGGWQGLAYPAEYGGQGLPLSLALFQAEMAATANFTWSMYPGLSKGAINTILAHGPAEMKKKYLTRMISGEWTGTMCLTEPQCGSDLNQVSTKAIPFEDGSKRYKISGTKIFISCGEHNMVNNIVHCVLARLPGAPEGTKGISLFLVPKYQVDDSGAISSDVNGLSIGRIEDKMGCHGSSTCEINFDNAVGYLIGEENKGMNHMFTFINTSRIGTSIQGVGAAEASFQNALWYTKERRAFRALNGTADPSAVADPIIVHPDIRKMLLTQKAIAEGGRSMIYECAMLGDALAIAQLKGNKEEYNRIDDTMGFLTPILKGFLTEKGIEAATLGVQLYGGHGYIKSNKQEQILRDVRISAIWEGTTGIQALDLLGRKIFRPKAKLAPIKNHCQKLRNQAWEAWFNGKHPQIKAHGRTLYFKALQWHYLTLKIASGAMKDKDVVGIASVDYLMYAGYITLAEHWLRMESVAAAKMTAPGCSEEDKKFYQAKLQTASFVFENILPRTEGLKVSMMTPASAIMGMKAEHFSFDHSL